MCGLAGFTAPHPEAPRRLGAMLDALRHRGPDQEGTHVDAGIAFGHCRLIVVAPDGGRQPRVDAATGDALVFNGEIYDFRRHAEDLRGAGVPLRDGSDTEVLFACLRRFGVERTLEKLDVMFAFAYRDGATGRVSLARDRCGEKPLFYGLAGDRLVFASELKAILIHPDFADAGFDPIALNQFLAFDFVPAPRTGVAGVQKLPAGHVLTFDRGTVDVRPYWRPVFAESGQDRAPEGDRAERLHDALERSVRARLVADVPVGVFLSGGIDSSLIAALAGKHAPGLTALTVRFRADGYDETPFAAEVARLCGLRHRIVDVDDADMLDAWSRLDELLDEPLADASIIPTFLVCRAARETMTVALGGDGGDELFAGYPTFQALPFARPMSWLPRGAGALARDALAWTPPSDRYMSLEFRLRQLSHGFGAPPDHQPFLWMAPFAPEDRHDLARAEFRAAAGGERWHAPLDGWLAGFEKRHPVERHQRALMGTYLAEGILAKVDRASMYNSLEVRSPFLAREVVAFALGLPPAAKIDGWRTKHLLKRVAGRYLPRALTERAKHGFAPPMARMLRGPLRPAVEAEILAADNPLAPWFDRARLARLVAGHMAGRADHRKKIWNLFQLFRFGRIVGRGNVVRPA